MKALLVVLCLFPALAFAQPGYINTIAGNGTSGYSGDGGPASAANFSSLNGIIIDNAGNIYVSDYFNNRIRRIAVTGIVTTVAGTGSSGYSGDGGAATAASINYPMGLALDAGGNMYFADAGNNAIRKINSSGTITTIAGTGSSGSSGDGGPATTATFSYPTTIAIGSGGEIYIADHMNHKIRMVNTSGIVSTIVGTGSAGYAGDGGPATAALLNQPYSVTLMPGGEFYIADYHNHVIRKVDASHTISTFTGVGTSGYSGDGGPASAARFDMPQFIKFDVMGNAYVDDMNNHVIRKINASGIISTVAGNGHSGFGGDGGPATAARFSYPAEMVFNAAGNMLIADFGNYRVREIAFAPTYTSDSFNALVNKRCAGPQIVINPIHYSSGMYIKTWFGDGSDDSSAITTSGCMLSHSYYTNGTYTIKHVLHSATAAIDSFQFTYAHTFCNSFPVHFYYDANSNCSNDTGEGSISSALTIAVDSNGVTVDTLSAISGLYYTAYGSVGDVYAFRVISAPPGLHVTCPSTSVIYDTLSAVTYAPSTKYMALACTGGSGFDLSVHAVIPVTGNNDQWANVYIQNAYCTPTTGTIRLDYSPKYAGGAHPVTPAPASTAGNSIVWNISGLSSTLSTPPHLYYAIWSGGTLLTIGDTVHSHFTIAPGTGDADTSDNMEIIFDTVRAGCDPNAIYAKPGGCIASGTLPIQLQYTITFENTGNDTAHNIYVMDTLSDYVDVNSMRLVLASHEMYVSKVKRAGHNILKFDFPKINLRDSSHHGECDGVVIYTINTKPGLSTGTDIMNRAGIYFDVNAVVMTNEAHNVIGCPPASVANLQSSGSSPMVYPNPAYDILNISADSQVFESCTITNSVGSIVLNNTINGELTQVNIKTLPAGLYFVNLKGSGGNVVKKFVKI